MEPTILIRDDDLSKTVAEAASSRGFQIVRLLSDSGGMADVYEAFQISVRRRVAAKRLKPHLSGNREIVARFREEGEKLGLLSHPNIVQVIDYDDATLTLFMEYIEGAPYDEILEREGFPTLEKAVEIVCEVLDGLAYAHKRRVVHRDIKPGNIFLTSDGHVKIADFGIAKILGDHDDPTEGVGGWIGSPSYISPEQILQGKIDGRADLYSTGIMLYLLVSHRLPFSGKTPRDLAACQLNDRPVPPSSIKLGIPPELNAVIVRALEKDPDKRYQTAAEFRAALLALFAPRQDLLYLEQAQDEFATASRLGFMRRKAHLDNARKLAELSLDENPSFEAASDLLAQVRKALLQQNRQRWGAVVMSSGFLLAVAAGIASLLARSPGALDVMVVKPVDIIVDGERLGTAPGKFQVSAGKHRLVYSIPGVLDFPPGGREILIQENKTLEETPVVPNLAEVLVVSTEHSGKQITLDGLRQSVQVPSKLSLLYGEHTLEVAGIRKTILVDQDALKVDF